MTIVTRFAPSPTGFLHIGGARTALFNWLFSKHHGGRFLLRIEDTDRKRSTPEAVAAILDGLKWLELEWDGEPYFQTQHEARHKEVAEQLVTSGAAYYCYCTQEELAQMRDQASRENKPFKYDGRWRDRSVAEAPKDVKPSIRLKTPLSGETVIDDKVQGRVVFPNADIDDQVILRSDGTPTYMLAVVVDDHDMGVTHIIRGDDHLNNAAKQQIIYQAMGWDVPVFAHIPLIHGPDGAKLSKRHGALGVDAYRDMGYLPEAMRNYLLRLGWSHGDDEIISTEQAIEWFGLEHVGRSAARFDFDKLGNLNGHYIRAADNARLVNFVNPLLKDASAESLPRIEKGMGSLKERAKTLLELATAAQFYITRLHFTDKAKQALTAENKPIISEIVALLENASTWHKDPLHKVVEDYAASKDMKFGKIAPALRAALVGDLSGPNIFEIMEILGQEETLARLREIP